MGRGVQAGERRGRGDRGGEGVWGEKVTQGQGRRCRGTVGEVRAREERQGHGRRGRDTVGEAGGR